MENQDVILAAINEHGERFQKAHHELRERLGETQQLAEGLAQEFAAIKSHGGRAGGSLDAGLSPVTEFLKSPQLQAMRDALRPRAVSR